MSTNVANWDKYDTILIEYPIWWEISAWSVNTFVKSNDFTNKTIMKLKNGQIKSNKADNYKLLAFNI